MKKLVCMFTILALTFAFVGCGGNVKPNLSNYSSLEQSSVSSQEDSLVTSKESSQIISSEISSEDSFVSSTQSTESSFSSNISSEESSSSSSVESSITSSSQSSQESISSNSSVESSISSQESVSSTQSSSSSQISSNSSSSSSSVELPYGYTYDVVGKSESLVEVSIYVNGEKVTRLEQGQTYTLVVRATKLITNPLAKIKVNGTYVLDVEASGSNYYESHDTFTSDALICEGDIVIEIYVVSSSPFM